LFFLGPRLFFGAIHASLLNVLVVSVADKGAVATQWLAASMNAICLMLGDHIADTKVQQNILNPWGPAVGNPLFSQKKSLQKDHSVASGMPMLALLKSRANFSTGGKGGGLRGD
jgi:hypothetical protein